MCAIVGVRNSAKAAEIAVLLLHGVQHRAKDYAGVVTSDGTNLYRARGVGIARDVFTKEMLDGLHGLSAIGHIRYPTVSDKPNRDNAQPVLGAYDGKSIAIAHNGNITNIDELKAKVKGKMATSMDTEYILRLLEEYCTGDIIADLTTVVKELRGSFSILVLTPDHLIALRDKSGNRPLSIGQLGSSYFFSSENCPFANIGAEYMRDVPPGSMIWFDKTGMHELHYDSVCEKRCVFEHIYFAHPASSVFGYPVDEFRAEIGRRLEALFPAEADFVSPIPDSSNFYAIGFGESRRSGKFWPVIHRSHYGSRSFIAATQAMRDKEVALKFEFSDSSIKGKRIVILDDSIVRGTTMPKIVNVLRQRGAKAVHVRIGYPEFKYRCIYGINTPTTEELISSHKNPEEICKIVGADSLEFLPVSVLKDILHEPANYCFACLNGKYW